MPHLFLLVKWSNTHILIGTDFLWYLSKSFVVVIIVIIAVIEALPHLSGIVSIQICKVCYTVIFSYAALHFMHWTLI